MSDVLSEVNNAPLSAVEVYYGKPTEDGCRLLPAPLVDFTEEPQFDDSGNRTSLRTRLTLTGSVLIVPSGSYEQMYEKQEALRQAFSVDNKDFVIQAGEGNKTLNQGVPICSGLTPKVISLNIAPDLQFNRIDYTVELEDLTAASGVSGVTSSLSNQWTFQEDQDSCTLNVTHNVSAEGPDGEADKFDQALAAVKPLLGIENLPIQLPCFAEPNASGLYNLIHPSNPAGGPVFEVSVTREEVADVANGTYSVTEQFVIVSGVPFFFNNRQETFSEDANGIATITIAGTVQGLGRTLSPSFGAQGGVGFDRACSGWLNQVKPQLPDDASGVYLKYKDGASATNDVLSVTSTSITQNTCRGTVDFNISYTDDPSANLPSGLVSRTCSVNVTDGVRLFASHAIPFRRLGNVIQDIKTTTEGSVSIQCQAQAKNTGDATLDTNRAISFVEDELNRLKAVHANPANYVDIRVSNVAQTISDTDLTCSATVDFTFTVDLANVQSVTSDITLRSL
jgi:hypothetical protein